MKKIVYTLPLLMVLLTVSCSKDYLNRPPLGKQTDENFYNSPGAGFKTVVNCYLGFYEFWGYQAAIAELGNMATDESDKGGSDANDRPFVVDLGWGRSLATNETLNGLWGACYKGIGNCNVALERLPAAQLLDDKGNPLDDKTKARYLAEIRFLRAYYYLDLVRIFGGVPLLTKTLQLEDRNKIVRAASNEVFQFIVNELEAVGNEAALPSRKDLPAGELGRVTKEAAWAVQARAYLFFAEDDKTLYAKARDAAKKVIDASAFTLDPQYQALFLKDGYKSPEAVFPVIFGDDPAAFIYGTTLPIYCSPRSVGGWGFDCPTQSLVDEYEPGDPRILFTVLDQGDVFPGGETLDFSSYPNTGHHNRKVFLPANRRGQGWGNDAWTMHLVRYADVLLMYAEALIESGGSKQEAANYINMVRNRASNSSHTDVEAVSRKRVIAGTPLPPVTAADDLRKALRHERRVEMGCEYGRVFDLLRWNIYVSTMKDYATRPYSNGKGSAFRAPASGNKYLFPIPQQEIDRTGGGIKQNPGY
ncbi:RagB/SusD family nutrient uptake outer membrane protein [Chitinophaga oryzae]|uniref:RagB/SusD family nutrient uptake outer membrane protein n=1 Tax=Chitinophaga oryzae TaxID=2725414 RepID=A0ABX6L8T6_9BACT|nr:RagB/SusD family nutrient uptake outer membrane protein [Chitinophaga oryzae]QJB36521.1 RagB/SusD family nutrient uptake outer membrane protein [Chitinophaga oryzae]